ncbi:MAG: zinc-finger domain-containing protein [Stellaceae bacterium]|jgi:uncharacterized Zn-finger protein
MPNFETIETDQDSVACDGVAGSGGHPRVYLNLGPAGRIECPYCSRTFVKRAPAPGKPGKSQAGH